ncbi:30S ribosome-binding factor RbfA [Gammaproteobacteria bacterium]|jgi:ribosome-binding factor A|nr:30S ribosome-binding factor RbfA [Gammaproteobacteria bacterium]MDB9996751.1 30S ribosome-binding factor RbfA [Gammaproteobacteria bacterium]|tara:strand:+ start:4494 stop:4835 length:342 start_codon:yes stop_codon:yes gene_type:complete
MSSIRAQKVSDFLRKEISLLISTEINDPRLKNINITAVKVSSDIGQATIYYTIIGQEEPDLNLAPKTLEKLSGMLRSRLSKIMKIRRVPKLSFRFDESIEYSNNIEELLKNLK